MRKRVKLVEAKSSSMPFGVRLMGFDPNASSDEIRVDPDAPRAKPEPVARQKRQPRGQMVPAEKIVAYAAEFPEGTVKLILLAVAKVSATASINIAIERATRSPRRMPLRPMIAQHVSKALE